MITIVDNFEFALIKGLNWGRWCPWWRGRLLEIMAAIQWPLGVKRNCNLKVLKSSETLMVKLSLALYYILDLYICVYVYIYVLYLLYCLYF